MNQLPILYKSFHLVLRLDGFHGTNFFYVIKWPVLRHSGHVTHWATPTPARRTLCYVCLTLLPSVARTLSRRHPNPHPSLVYHPPHTAWQIYRIVPQPTAPPQQWRINILILVQRINFPINVAVRSHTVLMICQTVFFNRLIPRDGSWPCEIGYLLGCCAV
jgi:hypothetical protein